MNYQAVLLKVGTLLILWGVAIGIFWLAVLLALKYRTLRHYLQKECMLLELTPPPSPHNTLLATEEFFGVLQQAVSLQNWRDRVSGSKPNIALEVVSSREQGIRFIVRLPKVDESIFVHNLAAAAPTVEARQVQDYLSDNLKATAGIIELRQSGPKLHPLQHANMTGKIDPIAYLTNAMSQLEADELVALQVVIAPVKNWQRPTNWQTAHIGQTHAVPADLIAATLYKSRQPLFYSSLRVLVCAQDVTLGNQRMNGIRAALATFSYDGYQSLVARISPFQWLKRYRLYAFRHRLPNVFRRHSCLLASSEIAALYHFPYGTAAVTPDLITQQSAALPVPLSVKNQAAFDIVLGQNEYRGRTTPIGLTERERQRHTYIVGGTGNGKTTLMQYQIVQDIRAGRGVAVIDPHGDMAETLLRYVPDNRIDDVIYFDPSDFRFPIGLNLLELPAGLNELELIQEKDLVTEAIVSMFRKIFSSNDASGHRIEYVIRNVVQTALTLEKPTLFTVYTLLNDPDFRRRTIRALDDPDLKLFWREFNKAGSYQQVSMAAGVTAKIGRFLFSAAARQILEQPVSTINFDDILNQGKILICNVSKGKLGEDTAELFGIMVLAKLQLATLRRAKQPVGQRPAFYTYVDEFQNFATAAFVQLLSEARKYGLFLTMAEQSTSQQSDPRTIDIIFANVGNIIAFRTSSPRDEKLLQPLLAPHVSPGSLHLLPSYTFYVRIAADITSAAFTGRTMLLDGSGDDMTAALVIQASRMKYAGNSHFDLPKADPLPDAPVLTTLSLGEGAH